MGLFNCLYNIILSQTLFLLVYIPITAMLVKAKFQMEEKKHKCTIRLKFQNLYSFILSASIMKA